MFEMNDPYIQFLTSRKNKVIYMKPWDGNSGDVLIWMGTNKLLADLEIKTTVNPKESDVVLIPGGNQTMWQENVNIWKEVWSKYPEKEFVVGPATFQFDYTDWFREIVNSGVTVGGLFARDRNSYTNLLSCKLNKHIVLGLSHDPALYLRDSNLIRRHKEAVSEEFILAAFRNDHEAFVSGSSNSKWLVKLLPKRLKHRIIRKRKSQNRSQKIYEAAKRCTPDIPLKVCDTSTLLLERFFEIVRSAKEVHTDRLHCLLLAIMLGKQVFAYPTSYGKLESVYEHSLKTWADVTFPSIK